MTLNEFLENNTIIATIRNRDGGRIKTLVESARKNGITSPFLIADFGSYKEFSAEYEKLCKELNIQYVFNSTEGLPWSRGQALNFGIASAKTKFITTTDIDMLFDSNPYEWIAQNCEKHGVFAVTSYWLPKNGDKLKSKCAGKGSCGGFQCVRRDLYEKLGAYDEKIKYWGLEDLDWSFRLKRIGEEPVWLPDEYQMFHQWHPQAESGHLRPDTARFDTLSRYYQNAFEPNLGSSWGKILGDRDRPILGLVSRNELCSEITPETVQFAVRKFDDCFSSQKMMDTIKANKFIKLEISPRIKEKAKTPFASFIRKAFKLFGMATGQVIGADINYNFDYFYAALLPVLQKNGLKDYYISENLENIYLLMN